tara:strand:- start:9834 stop:10496 length:663 start_codon:yes stop_codon:yes gene_type:complete
MLTLITFLLKPLKNLFKFSLINYGLKKKNKDLKISWNSVITNTTLGKNNSIQSATLSNSTLGDFSYVGLNSYLNHVNVGKFTCIGPHVQIGLGEHPIKGFVSVHPAFYSPIKQVGISFSDQFYFKEYHTTTIGNDVWIGANVIVIGGVKIGNGAVIAAGAVVVKDVPAYALVGGVPAKVIKFRFKDDEIRKLQEFAWWDKELIWLKENFKKFHSINSFFK